MKHAILRSALRALFASVPTSRNNCMQMIKQIEDNTNAITKIFTSVEFINGVNWERKKCLWHFKHCAFKLYMTECFISYCLRLQHSHVVFYRPNENVVSFSLCMSVIFYSENWTALSWEDDIIVVTSYVICIIIINWPMHLFTNF